MTKQVANSKLRYIDHPRRGEFDNNTWHDITTTAQANRDLMQVKGHRPGRIFDIITDVIESRGTSTQLTGRDACIADMVAFCMSANRSLSR